MRLAPILCLFLTFYVQADYKDLYKLAEKRNLSSHPEWLAMLHYSTDANQRVKFESYVDDTDFFLSPEGTYSPRDELRATIYAFFGRDEDITSDDTKSKLCRFIARYRWLLKQLAIQNSTFNIEECVEYTEWRSSIKADNVSLIFPAAFLNSPSSMFGHTLLRFDPPEESADSQWLSWALNFGAEVTSDDISILYAYKGIFGGYPGYFVMLPYYKKIQEYSRLENRDIWEYRLNLSPREVNHMIDHVWSLKGIRFDYFFFDENCSFRLLELLNVARPGTNITKGFDISAIPVDTIRAVRRNGFLSEAKFRPSQANLLQAKANNLDTDQQVVSRKIAHGELSIGHPEVTAYSSQQQSDMLDLSYHYLRYLNEGKPREEASANLSYQLLREISQLPKPFKPNIVNNERPEDGHASRMMMFSAGVRDSRDYLQWDMRLSYHDILDNEYGYLRGAQINLGRLQLRKYHDENITLQRLDLIDIFSLPVRNSFIDPISWKVKTGWERNRGENDEVLTPFLDGGAGITYSVSENTRAYGLLLARLEHNPDFSTYIEPAMGLRLGGYGFDALGAHEFSAEVLEFTNDSYRYKSSFQKNFEIDTNHSIRLRFSREWHPGDRFNELELGYRYFF